MKQRGAKLGTGHAMTSMDSGVVLTTLSNWSPPFSFSREAGPRSDQGETGHEQIGTQLLAPLPQVSLAPECQRDRPSGVSPPTTPLG